MTDENEIRFNDIDEFYEHIAHYGTPRHSGRYPWGSGKDPYQNHSDFLKMVRDLELQGMSLPQIAKGLGVTSTELRAWRTIAVTEKRKDDIAKARKLHDTGMSNVAIGKEMGIGESTVRGFLQPELEKRANKLDQVRDVVKRRVDDDGYIDVSAGTEQYLGVSKTKKDTALAMLEAEGYNRYYWKTEQLGTGNETNMRILARPDKTYQELKDSNGEVIKFIGGRIDDNGDFITTKPPVSIKSKRLQVRYANEGGSDMDGVIEIRRGVDDLSLNGKNYAQVRIAVDGDRYLKGMAMYADDLPDGVDLRFNTNKSDTGNKLDALKKMERDVENPDYIDKDFPFGSMVTQRNYTDAKGKTKQSAINVVGTGDSINEEGRWNEWSRTLSSQMLSKQTPNVAKQQLDVTYKTKRDELDEILRLNNPVVRKKLLEEFADGADSSAVHLKAAGLPRTRNQVILPINSLKDGEVYAPNFNHGEKVVLVRHPHGGIFEIPELIVNNKNKDALRVIKQAQDAIGINANVAARLSGADFDGDTVLVIPNNDKRIKTAPPLRGLKDFDPQADYKMPDGQSNGMTPKGKQKEMGVVSNLITDMTIKKASEAELARAVRHSMVVIDAEKHNLDYKQSAKDNNIAQLKKKYQFDTSTEKSGASTIISRAKSQERPNERRPRPVSKGGPVNLETGEKVWEYTGETYVNKNGVEVPKKAKKSTKMAETNDAFSLVSQDGGTPMERVYANHANQLKSLANQARKAAAITKPPSQNPLARKTYANEVASLTAKLNVARKNAPLERQAQLIAKATVARKKEAHPNLDDGQIKKLRARALEVARIRVGAKKETVTFTPKEWEAVQNNAISASTLAALLNNAKNDHLKEIATPRSAPVMTAAKISRARSLLASGHTMAEIAQALGISASTIQKAL